MYPVYSLEIFVATQREWVRLSGCEASNRPHHYDFLRRRFEQLVKLSRSCPVTVPLGYRICQDGHACESWMNGPAARLGAAKM